MSATATLSAQSSGTFSLGGKTPVHRLGFGAMRLTGEGIWGEPKDRAEAKRVLQRAVELGVDFIDTADAYGPFVSEEIIAEALHPYPKGLVIATKGGLVRTGPNAWQPVGRPEYLQQEVEMSLRRLKVERIDLWQLHRIDPKVPVEESLAPIKKLQEQGKILHVGLSEVKPHEIDQARKVIEIVSVQNQYNLGDRQHEDVVDYCTNHNLAFIPWFPVAAGKLARARRPARRRGKEVWRHHGAALARVAAAPLAGHSAHPGHVLGQASRGEHRRRLAQARSQRVEDHRSRREEEVSRSKTGHRRAAQANGLPFFFETEQIDLSSRPELSQRIDEAIDDFLIRKIINLALLRLLPRKCYSL